LPEVKTEAPKVSVVSIALHFKEFRPLIEQLSKQTYQDFEFIGEAGGSIPEAWNRAVKRARGEILVFTETDVSPVNEFWLKEMVDGVKDTKTIVKGLEVTSSTFTLSNLAAHRKIFTDNPFDDSFNLLSDLELVSRLKSQMYHLISVEKAPVINLSQSHRRHFFRKAFQYGFEWGRLKSRYEEPVEFIDMLCISNRLRASLNQLMGIILGVFLYLPERRKRRQSPGRKISSN
jgi:hypothetical protein